MTAEEFEVLPDDGKRYELLDGELREMAPTIWWHGVVEVNVATRLNTHVQAYGLGRVSSGEIMVIVRRNPDRVRAADVAFIRQDRIPPLEALRHALEVVPDLIVEVLSQSDKVGEISEKIDDWLGAGTQMLWIIDPFRRTVTIYQPGRDPTMLGEHAILAGDPVVPGFRCPVAEIFV